MANELCFYARPPEVHVSATFDNGQTLTLPSCVANGRDDAHQAPLPAGITRMGAKITATREGGETRTVRGIVSPSDVGPAAFWFDDFGELPLDPAPAPEPTPPPKPNPDQDPFAIIDAVYQQGDYDLGTKEGCGEYTDAACKALHTQHYQLWGHIRKEPPQNMWEGHAVDAVMLLAKAGATDAGIYDIILDTESPNAQPSWSYKGPPDPNLWIPPV